MKPFKGLTRRRVGIVGGEIHVSFEVASVIERVGVYDDERYVPS